MALLVTVSIAWGSPTAAASATPVAPGAPANTSAPDQGQVRVLPMESGWIDQVLRTLYPELDEVSHAEQWRFGQVLGLTSHTSAVAQELAAPRWLDPRIGDLYQQYLGRSPDPAGLAHWRGASGNALLRLEPADLELVAVGLGSSGEAWRAAGSTPAGFVSATYQAVLGRSVDPGGLAHWTARMQAGTGRQTLVRSLLRSTERARKLVADTYLTYLGRKVDTGGAAGWIERYSKARVGELRFIVSLLASSEARGQGCDPIDPRNCLLPFPNDQFTVPDATMPTGRRLALRQQWLPRNNKGVGVDPVEWNRNDGFSVGQAALVRVPGIDLAQTGAAPLTDIGASLDPDAPIVVIDADTGERHPVFAELDQNAAATPNDQLLVVRPGRNYLAGHRYIVAMRDLRNASGAAIEAGAAFRQYRDGQAGDAVGNVEARRPHMEELFASLGDAGIARQDLYLAWDFTVASTENTTGRLLHMRDDALQRINASGPSFDVESVTEDPQDGVARRVVGTYDVPLYINNTGRPGGTFAITTTGLPSYAGTYKARFDCELPELAEGELARAVVYGHGLFGSHEEVRSGAQRAMVRDHQMAYCATDWIGMSASDLPQAAQIAGDVSYFNRLVDRSQQGILNTIVLGTMLVHPDGFVTDPAFQDDSGDPLVDTSDLFYDGNSQGGVMGGALLATSPDVSAGVLGVAGMNYSTLVERSVDFDPFAAIMDTSYPSRLDRILGLQLIQMLWDRGETNGYAAHLTDDPLPGSSAKRVLVHTALGDHQVAPFTAEIMARTAGIALHRPAFGPGRAQDVDPGWDLPAITYPSTGSGLVIWDAGAALPPLGNVPPRTGTDPHQAPRNSPAAQAQKAEFLRTGGTLVDACAGEPCTA